MNLPTLNLADDLCIQQRLATPTLVSLTNGNYEKLYQELLGVVIYPKLACPGYYDDIDAAESALYTLVKIGGALAFATVTAVAAKKLYDYYYSKPMSNVKGSSSGSL